MKIPVTVSNTLDELKAIVFSTPIESLPAVLAAIPDVFSIDLSNSTSKKILLIESLEKDPEDRVVPVIQVAPIAHINSPSSLGIQPIFYVLHRKSMRLLEIMINRGADVNVRDWSGQSPLMYAVETRIPLDIVARLLAAGADSHIKDNFGQTPLTYAVARAESDGGYYQKAAIILSSFDSESRIIRHADGAEVPTIEGASSPMKPRF